jgi:hypothetical protein
VAKVSFWQKYFQREQNGILWLLGCIQQIDEEHGFGLHSGFVGNVSEEG